MRKSILIVLAVVLVVALGAGVAVASNSQPASKATAAVGYINVISAGEPASSTIMAQKIKIPGNKKDLLVNVSLETGLYTETVVKTKNAERETATATATINVRVLAQPLDNNGDPDGDPIIAHPNVIVGYDNGDPVYNGGWVTFDYRTQVLTAVLQGIITDITCGWIDPDGIPDSGDEYFDCWIDPEDLEPEEIGLLLDTMAAHSFNFILPDLPVGTYLVEVEAEVADTASVVRDPEGTPLGTAEANATIGLGSVTIEAVRMIRGEVIDVVEPPAPPEE